MYFYKNYLNKSLIKLCKTYIDKHTMELNDEYNFMAKKTILLFNKTYKYINVTNNKIYLASCFWIVNKFCDDEIYLDEEIVRCFGLTEDSKYKLRKFEISILTEINWDLSFINREQKQVCFQKFDNN